MSVRSRQIILWICGLTSSLYGLGLTFIGVPMMLNNISRGAWETSSWPFVLVSGLGFLISGLGTLFAGGRWATALLTSVGFYFAAVSTLVGREFFAIVFTPVGVFLIIVPLIQGAALSAIIFRSETSGKSS